MKNKILALGAVVLVFLSLSSLKVKVPVYLPKVEQVSPVNDWAEDSTISKQKLKYLDQVYESANY